MVDVKLEEIDPPAFGFLLEFAKDNELKMRPGRTRKRPEDTHVEAVIAGDTSLPPG